MRRQLNIDSVALGDFGDRPVIIVFDGDHQACMAIVAVTFNGFWRDDRKTALKSKRCALCSPNTEAASIDELELWLDRALDADSLAGVFAQ